EGVQVTYCARVSDRFTQRRQLVRDTARRRTALHSLFEQSDPPLELDELALVIGQRFFRCCVGKLSDRALPTRRAHEDGARLVHSAPRSLTLNHSRSPSGYRIGTPLRPANSGADGASQRAPAYCTR